MSGRSPPRRRSTRGGRQDAAAAAAANINAAATSSSNNAAAAAPPPPSAAAAAAAMAAGSAGRGRPRTSLGSAASASASASASAASLSGLGTGRRSRLLVGPGGGGGRGGPRMSDGGGSLKAAAATTANVAANVAANTVGNQKHDGANTHNTNISVLLADQQQASATIRTLRGLLHSSLLRAASVPPSPLNCRTASGATNAVYYGSLLTALGKSCNFNSNGRGNSNNNISNSHHPETEAEALGLPSDSYWYARALALNHELRRACHALEAGGLLPPSVEEADEYIFDEDDGDNDDGIGIGNNNDQQLQQQQMMKKKKHKGPSAALLIEAALLAAECHAAGGEWDEAARILEEACVFPPRGRIGRIGGVKMMTMKPGGGSADGNGMDLDIDVGASDGDGMDNINGNTNNEEYGHEISPVMRTRIDQGDDGRLDDLARLFRSDASDHDLLDLDSNGSAAATSASINLISRLACLRGIAYDELGHATRAASWLGAALRLDPRNVQALHHMLDRRLIDRAEERELVLGLPLLQDDGVGLDGSESGSDSGSGSGSLLRDLYLARLGFVPETEAGKLLRAGEADGFGTAPAAASAAGAGAAAAAAAAASSAMTSRSGARPEETFSAAASPFPVPPPATSSGVILQPQTPNLTFLGGRDGDGDGDDAGGASMMNVDESTIRMEDSQMGDDERKLAAVDNQGAAAAKARKPLTPSDEINRSLTNLTSHPDLCQSSEVLAMAAVHSYSKYDLPLTLSYCQLLERSDPFCQSAAYVHISALASLRYKRPLFQLAHRLVDSNPRSAQSWYAVGSYYYACGRYDLAQRHFCRAARLDPRSSECWLAFGCSFAACDESDQALASYRAASRLNPGDHFPLLYMGMEYVRTNHLSLAGHFLKNAWRTSGYTDPLVRSEMGVLHYRNGEWEDAVVCFVDAVRLVAEMILKRDGFGGGGNTIPVADGAGTNFPVAGGGGMENTPLGQSTNRRYAKPPLTSVRFANQAPVGDVSAFSQGLDPSQPAQATSTKDWSDMDCIMLCRDTYWEPTIFNLGQSYRKIRFFNEAIACFEKCLSICPGKSSSYSALGYTRHLSGDLDGAIEAYQQSLSRKPDDPFSSQMLMRALHESMSSPHADPLFEGEESFLVVDGGASTGNASILSPRGRAASAAASASFLRV